MTYVDMKYTSLFWKLGFVEETTDIYIKNYSPSYQIYIQAEKQEINYGENSHSNSNIPTTLYEHKDFVVLECVNKLLEKGYSRNNLQINGNAESNELPDIIVYNDLGDYLFAIHCKRWGRDYEEELAIFKKGEGVLFSYFKKNKKLRYLCLYTSRLDGGLLEYKNFFNKLNADALTDNYIEDYLIEKGVLIKYMGERDKITIPSNVQRIGTGAFWNCTSLKSVEIPNGVKCIGGDVF